MDDQEYLSQHLLWIGISIGIVFAILSYLPFPFSIPIAIASFSIIIFYLRKQVVKRINSRARRSAGSNNNTDQSLNYYCMACDTIHNEIACPKCGSKMKRVGS
jgi:membrane protein implicated in regulation of membrane protease activity